MTDLHCSFCSKRDHEVDQLVAGPGVYICNECVGVCGELLASTPPAAPAGSTQKPPQIRPWDGMSLEQILAHLPEVAAVSAQVEASLTAWVQQARDRGASWTAIGAALGMKRQSAWGRFSGED